ncbi:lamin tail domain-containing protein [Neorhodopirellula pilleata]|uniref:Inner spore coat protein H n=1 Tax=Neorhodopirellula pilleata TaxID=2714738 RepID=A0A5C6AZ46_9BACT|nr:lamin tail domain-containing protein [Neorhodopirellula pilleata]TWU03414.1 Inner spore coat protein H [Neorhodopirellula pilleata]
MSQRQDFLSRTIRRLQRTNERNTPRRRRRSRPLRAEALETRQLLAADICLNEIMADNDSVVSDEAGEFDDWIEIYNAGTEAVDLGGMYLTDDVDAPTQWQFPAGSTIAAGDYFLIWADDDLDQGDNHASFKLSSGGETVALFDADGTTLVDSIEFGAQVTDVAYGRSPDGSDTLSVLTTPTPGAANSVVGEANLAPTANAGGPYFGTTADTISLSASGSEDDDGSIATYAWDLDHDGEYDDATGEAASFSSTTVGTFVVGLQVTDDDGATSVDTGTIKISAVGDDGSPWDAVTIDDEAAAFFDDTYVHEVSITFEDDDWYNTLFTSHDTDVDDPYFVADFVADGIAIDGVGVRFKGNSSFSGTGVKKSIKIDFNEFEDLTFLGLKKLNLNNNFNDPTMLREKLFYDYASNFVEGVGRAVFTRVTINGEFYGLYTAVEQIDSTFTQSRFGDEEDGNLYKGTASDDAVLEDPRADFGSDLTYLGTDQADYEDFYDLKTNEAANDYSQLIEFIDVLNNTPSGELADAIEPLLDVDSTLTSLALNNLFVNLDSYIGAAHNYYVYDRDDTGQFTHIFWDVNESFGTFTQFVDRGQDPVEIDPFWLPTGTAMGPPGTPVEDESRPLAESLWAVDQYSTDYLRDLAQMLEDGFDVTSATARINELANLIRDDVTADPNKQYTAAQFEQNLTNDVSDGRRTIYGLTSFIEDRSTFLASALSQYDLEPESVEVYINEIMADNDATIEDPDEAGAFEDWIELYNPGTTSVDLSGFYLSDDAEDPTQWRFPSGSTIDAGGYLLIWADGDTDQGDDHAAFRLSAGGESVLLYNTDGTTLVDSVTFGEQTTDVSYGRFPDGSSTLTVLSAATPGAANTNDLVENVAPVAEAGGPYSGAVGDTISLSGATSTDSDGTIASYAWDLDNDGQYDDATGETASLDATTPGTFTVGLQVTDDQGANSTDAATITVTEESSVVLINEIMADNDATIEDPDEAGAFEDWIELYNPGVTSLDLSGFYLTDDAEDPTQWQFPTGSTIDAGGYLLIWADDDTDQGDNHASFRLSAGGESVLLYHTDGTTLVDSVTFGEQTTDVSYGRFPNGSSTLTVLSAATPGAANTNEVIENVAPIAEAGGPYTGTVGETISLSGGTSTDSDGTITAYTWDLDNDGQYDDATGETATFGAVVAGAFTVGLQVTDDDGATSTDTATITVNAIANVAPTADAGGPYSGTVGETVSLSGSASIDTDGTIATYAWDLDNDGQFDDATGVATSFSATTTGTFTVGLQVSDNAGATSVDTATITVSAAVTPGIVVMQSGNSTVVSESGLSDTISLSLSSQPTADVAITITSADTAEASVSPGQLTFTTENWNSAQTVTLSSSNDGLIDGSQTTVVSFAATSSDPAYATLADVAVEVVTQDADTSNPPTRIYTPDFVVRPHVIPGDSIPTAIIFRAVADADISVVPIGTASVGQTIRMLNQEVAEVGGYSQGVMTATVTAGQMYAIVFEPHSENRIYTVRSTAGTDAFTPSVPTNFLQPTDTNGDSRTTALDALVVINQLNREQVAEGEMLPTAAMYDVNQDGQTTALDALLVINELNRQNSVPSEGELVPLPTAQPLAVTSSLQTTTTEVNDEPIVDLSVAGSRLVGTPTTVPTMSFRSRSIAVAELAEEGEPIVSENDLELLACDFHRVFG